MFAVTGITGQAGGAVARRLLDTGGSIRAVVRDVAKGEPWAAKGCEIAVADMLDATALATASVDVEGVFILVPPMFDPLPASRRSVRSARFSRPRSRGRNRRRSSYF